MDSDQTVQGFTLTGGDFTGTGTLTITGSTTMSGGYMTGVGATRAEGGLLLDGANKYLQDNRRLVNANGQRGEWTQGHLYLQDTSTLVNESGATFSISGATRSMVGTGTGTLDNQGALTSSLISGADTVTISTIFNNSGSVDVDMGVLRLAGGGAHTGDFTGTANGELNISGGTHDFAQDSSITANQVEFSRQYNGTYDINGAYEVGNTTVSGNTVNFNVDAATRTLTQEGGGIGGAGTLTASAQTTMSGGYMTGIGTTRAEGGLLLDGANKYLQDSRRLVNANGQRGEWTQGHLYLQDTSTLVNESGATFNISGATRSLTGSGSFNNEGTVVVNTTGSDQVISTSTLNNTGSVDIQHGTLHSTELNYVNDGNIRIAAGATLSGWNSLENSTDGLITGSGFIDPGAVGTFTNAGQLNPGDGVGTLHVNGDLAMQTSSIFNVELGGLNDFDLLDVEGDSALDGTVNVSLVNGFTPTFGDTFDILLTEALSGEFSAVVAVNGGMQWSMRYLIDETGQDIARLTAVPVPAAGWLMLSGLAVLAGIRRRRISG
jgi:hypothetical protein